MYIQIPERDDDNDPGSSKEIENPVQKREGGARLIVRNVIRSVVPCYVLLR